MNCLFLKLWWLSEVLSRYQYPVQTTAPAAFILAGDFIKSFPATAWAASQPNSVTVPTFAIVSVGYAASCHFSWHRRK